MAERGSVRLGARPLFVVPLQMRAGGLSTASAGMVRNLMTKSPMPNGETMPTGRERRLTRQICQMGRRMYERGFVVACEGNLSVRLNPNRILITPTRKCKWRLTPDNLVIIDLNGTIVRGNGRPSSEMLMHLLYYRLRSDVQAVCHAHPPIATGFAAAGRALEEAVLPEVVVGLGKIPLAPYGTPGTAELCAGLESLVTAHDAILLENHGLVTCGQDLDTAYERLEIVEHFARVLLIAQSLGGPNLLSRTQLQKLSATKSRETTDDVPSADQRPTPLGPLERRRPWLCDDEVRESSRDRR
jgi:L-fuculose-phosphate aldolase